jgi:hypothetical protein
MGTDMKITSYAKIPVFAILIFVAFIVQQLLDFVYGVIERCGIVEFLDELEKKQ